ncbi:MAG: hypothetical protein L6R42_009769, partial [Xanthoria sp. 1 TBL-2021]
EVVEDERKKRRKVNRPDVSEDDSSSDEGGDSDDGAAPAQNTATPRATRRTGTPRTGRHSTPKGAYTGQEGEGDDDDEDLYTATPRTQRTSGRPTQQSSSQMSVASSRPASQLVTSQTDDSQNTNGSSQAPSITPARLRAFRTALGQLLNTPLFQNDSADVEPLVDAVNSRVGREQRFEMAEANAALLEMQESNQVM